MGFGQKLVLFCEAFCASDCDLIWFNARKEAVGFYEKLGYTQKGELFAIAGVGEHIVLFKKIKND
ncbi:GNAT family N-acetyltransferase [Flavobacterium restrictum]|uniref:GNAT family N-acetyltransferase n=1 Tax=Flavobacterium restrictum TaxID=2594428 RepID=UPI001F45ADA6|nr:GNAT family N-acetyltransferase [Flavobacterium restrictum]